MTRKKAKKQRALERIKNFHEVSSGFSEDEAIAEAGRCLQCKHSPCVKGCPAEIEIPAFIKAIKERRFEDAIFVINKSNNLAAVCGRVCPQEDQCEKFCVLAKKGNPISIGYLERFAADRSASHDRAGKQPANQEMLLEKVAVIGAGPAGLTCAADLARQGYRVTVFEGLHEPGGVLIYGIPEFRLPKEIVRREIESIKKLGIDIRLNYVIGKIKTIDQLRSEGFRAFFISTGAGLPLFMGIEGENLNGVYSANEFLSRVNLMKAYKFPEYDTPIHAGKNVAVIGGGNVAVDAARSALRLGAEKVWIVYRRTEVEMPARAEEVEHAKEEGVAFQLLSSPVKILGDERGSVRKLVCRLNRLGEPDDRGRRRPVPIENSFLELDVDTVIVAIGSASNPLLLETMEGLKLGAHGTIEADDSGRTNLEGVFAGGDIVTGSATIIAAMGAGKKGARAIHQFLHGSEKITSLQKS
jgi:glutamate synthase (NADPH/NADH) small chain